MSKRPTLEDLQKLPLVKVQDFTHFPRNRHINISETTEKYCKEFIPINDSLDEKQIIYGNPPSKSNSYRIITISGHGSLAKTKAMKDYENSFYIQCNKYRNRNIEDYFELYLDVFYPNQRSDLDGCMKVILDCLQKCGAIKNDNKAVKIVAQKFLDKERPRIEFVIKKI